METAKISEYRSHLSHYHTKVLENHEPLRITGGTRGDVVVLSSSDFETLQETIHVLKDKATMNSLLESRSDYVDQRSQTAPGKDFQKVFSDVVQHKNK